MILAPPLRPRSSLQCVNARTSWLLSNSFACTCDAMHLFLEWIGASSEIITHLSTKLVWVSRWCLLVMLEFNTFWISPENRSTNYWHKNIYRETKRRIYAGETNAKESTRFFLLPIICASYCMSYILNSEYDALASIIEQLPPRADTQTYASNNSCLYMRST